MRPADAARLLLLAAIWGSSFLLIKVALEDLSPLLIVAGRLVLGAAFLLVVLKARNLTLPAGKDVWRSLVVMAIVSNVIPFTLISWGEESITSSLAAILNATTPLFTAAIASMVLEGERLTILRATGIALGFVGVAVIVGVDVEGSEVVGELAVVAASLSYGVGFVFARRRLVGRADGPIALSAGQLMVASAIAVPLAAFDGGDFHLSLVAALCVAGLGIAGTGLGYVLYYSLVTNVGATSASFVTYLLPLFGVVLGALILDETLGLNTIVGAVLVISVIAVAANATRRPALRRPTPASDEPACPPGSSR
jgi:drug/metabolite transporter (DMT)-like permease